MAESSFLRTVIFLRYCLIVSRPVIVLDTSIGVLPKSSSVFMSAPASTSMLTDSKEHVLTAVCRIAYRIYPCVYIGAMLYKQTHAFYIFTCSFVERLINTCPRVDFGTGVDKQFNNVEIPLP